MAKRKKTRAAGGAPVMVGANPERVSRVQDLRRSNAAGVHAHRAARGALRRAAIRESAG